MTDFSVTTKPTPIDPKTRTKILAKVYAAILSWPDPQEKKTEPVVEDLGGEATTDSADIATTPKAVAD